MKVVLSIICLYLVNTSVDLSYAQMPASHPGGTEQIAPVPASLGTPESFSFGGSLLRMAGGLLFCFGVLGGGLHILKRYNTSTPLGAKRRIRIVERAIVSQKSSLVLVSLDGRELLLSVGSEAALVMQSQLPAQLPALSDSQIRTIFEENFSDAIAEEARR